MAIKKLYANGDSWTYGQELGDNLPDELDYKFYNSWPWWLAQRMNIPQVVNDSLGGSSCDRIFRRTIDYIKNQKDISDTVFILGWTSAERFEWPTTKKLTHHNGYSDDEWEEVHWISMLFSNDVSASGHERTWHDKLARINQFKNKWFRIRDYQADLNKVEQYIYILNELIKEKNSTVYHFWALGQPIQKYNILDESLIKIADKKQWSREKYGHPTVESHQKIADIIYDKIQNTAK